MSKEKKAIDKKASERTKQWILDNPNKYRMSTLKAKVIKQNNREEALEYFGRAKYKTPMKAIKAYCRNVCKKGISRHGKGYDSAPVTCPNKKCPFYCFRNGNPQAIKKGLKLNFTELVRNKRRRA